VAFPGGGANGYAPPDTNGAAGPTQFVQWVNVEYAVYNKTTGNRVFGPAPGNSFWTGFGGPCETSNDGDSIAQFDKAAGRWVMAQPVFSSPFTYCVAVSTTSDATGSYHRYAFSIPNNYFPDYPKLGVWSDAYYVSFNAFNSSGTAFIGALACALDRNAMLAGTGAVAICFQNGSSVDSLLPSDLDGSTPPPAGSPDYFVHFVSNALGLYRFHVDFTTPSNSTFTGPTTIAVNPFSEACGGGACIPQAGTSRQLDSLGDRLMYRLAYRNFGDHESLVVNHSVTAATSVGVRWYELRQTPVGTGGFSVYQQGTFAPDSSYRWMGSIAMDEAGDIALGYSVSSSSMHPSIAYTVHVPGTDALGTMQAETIIVNGTGSQTGGLNRWGDYSSMSIDPVDDCTFWYTTEYLRANGSFNWSTQIASFALPNCTGVVKPDFGLSATPGSQTVLQGGSASYTVSASSLSGFTGSVSLSASGGPSGVSIGFTPTSVTAGSGSSTMRVTVPSTATPGNSTVTITGTSGSLVHTATVTLAVQGFSISASPSSQTVVQGGSTTYTASVSSLNGFTGLVSLGASGQPSGVSVSFSPTSVPGSGSSTMTVTVGSTTIPGAYTLTISGTSGSLSHSTTVTLVVSSSSTPDFSISASPSSRTVNRGSSTSYTVTVTALNGFTGTVSFSVSGLPSRASASFEPTSVSPAGTSTLTVSTSGRTRTGTFTFSIKGTSGSLVHSTTVTLVVQ
jgi:hypothetical protein